MTNDVQAIAFRLAVLFLVVLAGWTARRLRWLGEPATRMLSRLCVDVCFPCLTFTQMLHIVGGRPLAEQGGVVALGAIMMLVALLAGRAALGGLSDGVRRTAWLAMATPNWIFFPLPIATLLYGADGLAAVLLMNVSAQFFLWTSCVAILRGFRSTARAGFVNILNPALVATFAGAALALGWPASRDWPEATGALGHVFDLLKTAGTLTIPLSMLVTGSQLGALARGWRIDPPLLRVNAARLVIIPLITLLVFRLLAPWLSLPPDIWRTALLIAAMPVAVSCGVLVERFGGDRNFISQSILLTTVAALVTVPALMLLAKFIY
ncbi:MAG TPA: AEC family transporter [Kiritimatiellia bacterium]|nr:AEC family transporter [Kiritimatiellia bacterium]